MTDDLATLRAETEAALAAAPDLRALDAVRVGVLGRSGSLSGLLKGLGGVPAEQRKERGAALNRLKTEIEALLDTRRTALEAAALEARLRAEREDVSLPPRPFAPGTAADGGIHPISRTVEELTRSSARWASRSSRPRHRERLAQFRRAQHPGPPSGAAGPRHLLPARHASRFEPRQAVLRTQTSPLQVRTMLASRRRSASSRPAAPTAPTTTRRTARCSTRWRGW
jgi:phenylalanyl-tRNA synthetase alpha chain